MATESTRDPYAQETTTSVMGYYFSDGTVSTYVCPSDLYFFSGFTVPGDDSTYARCDPDPTLEYLATGCSDDYVLYSQVGLGSDVSGSCGGGCVALTIYDSDGDEDEAASQYLADCSTYLNPPENIQVFFKESPSISSTITSDDSSSTTSDDASTSTDDSTTTNKRTSTSTVGTTPASGPTGGTQRDDNGGGLSGGVIAGIAIGALAGVC